MGKFIGSPCYEPPKRSIRVATPEQAASKSHSSLQACSASSASALQRTKSNSLRLARRVVVPLADKNKTVESPPHERPDIAAISGPHIAELYVLFCSLITGDNKVDVVRFKQLCEDSCVSGRIGPRLTCALQSVLKYSKIDWTTLAWYLDAPPGSEKDAEIRMRAAQNRTHDLRDALRCAFPVLRGVLEFRNARQFVRKRGGLQHVRHWLASKRLVNGEYLDVREGAEMNIFACMGAGTMTQADMEKEQDLLGSAGRAKFIVVRNLLEQENDWNDPAKAGHSAMGKHHRLLCLKDLHLKWFNALTFGLNADDLEEALQLIKELQEVAERYRTGMGWGPVGLFVHVLGHNSVPSFHLHVVDLLHVGPSFYAFRHKNCPLKVIEEVLKSELALASRPIKSFASPAVPSEQHKSTDLRKDQTAPVMACTESLDDSDPSPSMKGILKTAEMQEPEQVPHILKSREIQVSTEPSGVRAMVNSEIRASLELRPSEDLPGILKSEIKASQEPQRSDDLPGILKSEVKASHEPRPSEDLPGIFKSEIKASLEPSTGEDLLRIL